MTAKNSIRKSAPPRAFEATLAHLVKTNWLPRPNRTKKRPDRKSLLRRFLPRPAAPQPVPGNVVPDPVQVAVFAIGRVGLASVRAYATGTEVRVTAPDEATAAILRAALAETVQSRITDRLIRIDVG